MKENKEIERKIDDMLLRLCKVQKQYFNIDSEKVKTIVKTNYTGKHRKVPYHIYETEEGKTAFVIVDYDDSLDVQYILSYLAFKNEQLSFNFINNWFLKILPSFEADDVSYRTLTIKLKELGQPIIKKVKVNTDASSGLILGKLRDIQIGETSFTKQEGKGNDDYEISTLVKAFDQNRTIEIASSRINTAFNILSIFQFRNLPGPFWKPRLGQFNIEENGKLVSTHQITESVLNSGPVVLSELFSEKVVSERLKVINDSFLSENSNIQYYKKIKNCIYWLGNAIKSDEPIRAYISCMQVFETLLKDRSEKTDISHKIAQRCAFILGTSGCSPIAVYSTLKKAYSIRSRIIHEGITRDVELLLFMDDVIFIAKSLFYEYLYAEKGPFKGLYADNPDFFNELDEKIVENSCFYEFTGPNEEKRSSFRKILRKDRIV